jgi:sec-independent protein translocase protein TatA
MTSIWHWLILIVMVILIFSAGKIPKFMGDLAGGIKAFKKGKKEDHGGVASAQHSHMSNANLVVGKHSSPSPKPSSGKWKFVGAAVGGILGAIIFGAASLPFMFGLLAVPGFVFGVHYGGKVGSAFDYIEKP